MGELRVMGPYGDIVVEWDPNTPESVGAAKKEWAQLKKQGFEFFESEPGEKGKRLTKFDPELGRVIVAPGVKTKKDRKKGTREKAMAGGPNAREIGPLPGTSGLCSLKIGYAPWMDRR